MLDTLLSLVSGPLLGGIFGCVNAYIANKAKAQDQAHELAMTREERETRRVEAEMQMRVTEEEFSGKAFLASQAAGNKTALSAANLQAMLTGNWFMRSLGSFLALLLGLTDVARNAVRPGITIYLALACHNMLADFIEQTGGIGIAQRAEIVNYGVQSQFNLLATCVAWWFGDRMTNKLMAGGGR
jgi:hypothetical protein